MECWIDVEISFRRDCVFSEAEDRLDLERRKQVVQPVAPVAFGAVVDSAALILNDVQTGDVLTAGCVVRGDVAGTKFSGQRVF